MASLSEHLPGEEARPKKEGLRCGNVPQTGKFAGEVCQRLLLEKDPELGLGVRCDRCQKFQPLEELDRRAAGFENQGKRREEMASKAEEIMEAIKSLSQPEREELAKRMKVLTKKPHSAKEEVFPKKRVAKRDGYRVTVQFKGVFKEFNFLRGQQGDAKGIVVLEARGRKFKLGDSHFDGIDVGSDISGRINLGRFDEILARFYSEAANINMKLDPNILVPLLAEALSPYSWVARRRSEDFTTRHSVDPATEERPVK